MSLGSISRPKRISDLQFVGDLGSLFKRHRIESGDAGSLAAFESCLASKDNFRSQLFTLCTAISHMSADDLSGEEMLALIARALGVPESPDGAAELPESMRTAFLSGYGAWNTRDLLESAAWPESWPPSREPAANEPIPFRQPAENVARPAAAELHVPGVRTMQEALLKARKETPFELPARSAAAPSANGANIEDLTITELTKLLDDIERRMSRIKPHFRELNALARPGDEPVERPGRMREMRDFGETPASRATAAQVALSLVQAAAIEPAAVFSPPVAAVAADSKADPFLDRHTYLRPGRRLPPDTIVPIPFATLTPVPVEVPRAELPAKPAETLLDLAASRPERFRVKMQLAIGVVASLVLVASPVAGYVAYRLLHPTYVIEYQDVKPAALSDPGAASPAPRPDFPASPSEQRAKNSKGNGTHGGSRTTSAARNSHPAKRTPPVAVWPPPPEK